MSSFYVENFGCRAAQADGAAIEHQFREHGLSAATGDTLADWVVLNTCAVTAAAEQDARAAVRRIRRTNPRCRIVITGCYAQRAPEEVAGLPGVSHVIGNSHKHNLAQIVVGGQSGKNSGEMGSFVPVEALTSGTHGRAPASSLREDVDFELEGRDAQIFVSDIFAHSELIAAPVFDAPNERTRPNLKIQDGCNNRCSFCIIPSLRGRSRSLPAQEVLREVDQLVAAGYKEIVISGINLGRWGRDLPRSSVNLSSFARPDPSASLRAGSRGRSSPHGHLENLVRSILDHTSLEKLRISSVEPMDWSDSLIRVMAESPRIAKHAHVPMQSGSDAVLRRMHRKYRPWHYREKIERIHDAMPTAAIGADVMVGFPGETDSEFEETRRMVEELPFTYLHVFTFSARPGTPAASMPNQVPLHIARKRNRILREFAAERKLAFMRGFLGRQLQAITLATTIEDAGGFWTDALSDNYLKTRIRGKHAPNRWLSAEISDISDGRLMAEFLLP